MGNHTSRNSNPELLKIIAMLGIIGSHAALPAQTSEIFEPITALSRSTLSFQKFIIILFNYLAQIGNCLFVSCSSYFLLDSKSVKKSKILFILADYSTISIIALLVFIFAGYTFPCSVIIKQIFPILFNNNWFIGCYLLLYAIHPLLNVVVHNSSKKRLFTITFFLFLLFSVLPFIPTVNHIKSPILSFILLYFAVAYVKLHMKNFSTNTKSNLTILALSSIGLLSLVSFTNLLGLKIPMFSDKLLSWSYFTNPLIIFISISSINLTVHKYNSIKSINYLSSLTLLIYIIHCNRLIMDYFKLNYYQYMCEHFPSLYPIIWFFIYAASAAVISLLLAIAYKEFLQKHIHRFFKWGCKKAFPFFNRAFEKLTSVH